MKTENTVRKQYPLPQDLNVFVTVVKKGSFAEAARTLGQSPAYISKRITILEQTLNARVLHRSTRSIALTENGQHVLEWAIKVLENLDDLVGTLSKNSLIPRGQLNICSSFGFGRAHVAPAVAELSVIYSELEISCEVFDRPIDLVQEGFDLDIYIGDELPEQHISKLLAKNARVLCASPNYLKKYGTPVSIEDLKQHQCLALKERHSTNGVWKLTDSGGNKYSVKVDSSLSSNNGDIVRQWALHHRGIMLRSLWDVHGLLENGDLIRVLPEYSQSANIWAVYPSRLSTSAKTRVCVEFLSRRFAPLSI